MRVVIAVGKAGAQSEEALRCGGCFSINIGLLEDGPEDMKRPLDLDSPIGSRRVGGLVRGGWLAAYPVTDTEPRGGQRGGWKLKGDHGTQQAVFRRARHRRILRRCAAQAECPVLTARCRLYGGKALGGVNFVFLEAKQKTDGPPGRVEKEVSCLEQRHVEYLELGGFSRTRGPFRLVSARCTVSTSPGHASNISGLVGAMHPMTEADGRSTGTI